MEIEIIETMSGERLKELFMQTMIEIKNRCQTKFTEKLEVIEDNIIGGGACAVTIYIPTFHLVVYKNKSWLKKEKQILFTLVVKIYNGNTICCGLSHSLIEQECKEGVKNLSEKLKVNNIRFIKE